MMLRRLGPAARRALSTTTGASPPGTRSGAAADGAVGATPSALDGLSPPANAATPDASLGATKLYGFEPQPFHTQKPPVYTLPLYGAPETVLATLSDASATAALRTYGGLHRWHDCMDTVRDRLARAVRADYRPKQLTIAGVVVSDKMDKSVVVAARRQAYAPKLKLKYFKTRRFMAHDELNLCREGDRVVIRSTRPLSKRKAHVVVENFGDPTRVGEDVRGVDFGRLVEEAEGELERMRVKAEAKAKEAAQLKAKEVAEAELKAKEAEEAELRAKEAADADLKTKEVGMAAAADKPTS